MSLVELADGLFRLRLARKGSALRTNTYIHRYKDAVFVIDPAWPQTIDDLEAAMKDAGWIRSLDDVTAFVYTHTHVDHMGAAPLLAQRSNADHLMWDKVAEVAEDFFGFQDRINNWQRWATTAFVPEVLEHEIISNIRVGAGLVERYGPLRLQNVEGVALGEEISLGSLSLRLIETTGHDPYHTGWYEASKRWFFSGDLILSTPTPLSRAMDDSLPDYRDSLQRVSSLAVDLLLPGHGAHQTRFQESVENSLGWLKAYRKLALDALTARPCGLYELGLRTVAERKPPKPVERWFVHLALLETHLQELEGEGKVERVDGTRWRLCKNS